MCGRSMRNKSSIELVTELPVLVDLSKSKPMDIPPPDGTITATVQSYNAGLWKKLVVVKAKQGMLVEKTGNVFDTKAKLIAHGVSSAASFNYGFGRQIVQAWPSVKNHFLMRDNWVPGDLQVVVFVGSQDIRVANVAVHTYNSSIAYSTRELDLASLEAALEKLFKYCVKNKISTIAMPRIGCGLAGGKWSEVKAVLQKLLTNYDLTVEVYDGKGVPTAGN